MGRLVVVIASDANWMVSETELDCCGVGFGSTTEIWTVPCAVMSALEMNACN